MSLRPDIAVATRIGTEVASLTLGTNLFHGPIRPGSTLAVFCLLDGGPSPIACLGTEQRAERPNVQIHVRGEKGEYSDGLDVAESVRDAVHYAPLSGYIDVRVIESAPIYLGEEDDGQPRWSMNVDLTREVIP